MRMILRTLGYMDIASLIDNSNLEIVLLLIHVKVMNVMEMEQQNCSSSGLKQRQHISRPLGTKKPQSKPQVVRQKARDPAYLLKTICSRVNLVKKWNLRPHEVCTTIIEE